MIVLFSALATVEYDGTNYYCNEIQASLSRYRHCGRIICLAHLSYIKTPHSDPINMDEVEFVFIHKINSLKSLIRARNENKILIEKAVMKSDMCIVHVFSMHASMVINCAKKYHKPYLNVVVGCPWDSFWNYSLVGKCVAPFAYLSLRKIQHDAKYSIYVTNHFLQNRYPTKGNTVACSNVEMITGDENVLKQREERIDRNSYERIKIGTLAALNVRYKGQEYVIKALAELKKEGILHFEYHLVGGGDCSFLQSIAEKTGVSDMVVIHGAIPHKEVSVFLDNIDIYIQPSKQEGLPRALIEAMSRGCLCYGSRTAGIPELLQQEYIFPKGNSHAIAGLLSKVTKDDFVQQGLRNFSEARLYSKDILDKRRNEFLDFFVKNEVK